MDVKQGREIIDRYRGVLKHVSLREGPMDGAPCPDEELQHCHSMLEWMDEFLDKVEEEDRYRHDRFWSDADRVKQWDKFNRWLGFMQGVFWSQGVFTLNEMRGHNRS